MNVVSMAVTPVLHDQDKYDDDNWPSVEPLIIPIKPDIRYLQTPKQQSDFFQHEALFDALRTGVSYEDKTTGIELSVTNTQKRVRTLEINGTVLMLMISIPQANGRDELESVEFAPEAFIGPMHFELTDTFLAILGISRPRFHKGEFSAHAFGQTVKFSYDPLVLVYQTNN